MAKPDMEQSRILEMMTQGYRLACDGKPPLVATIGKDREVDLELVEEMEEEGWIYELDSKKDKKVWGITRRGMQLVNS